MLFDSGSSSLEAVLFPSGSGPGGSGWRHAARDKHKVQLSLSVFVSVFVFPHVFVIVFVFPIFTMTSMTFSQIYDIARYKTYSLPSFRHQNASRVDGVGGREGPFALCINIPGGDDDSYVEVDDLVEGISCKPT